MGRKPRREELLTIATRLFNDRGYRATTVRDIGDGVGMQSGSLYAHFDSKEEILFEIVVREINRAIADIEPILERDVSADIKLREAMRAHLRDSARFVHGARLFLYEWQALTGERQARVRKLRQQYEALWARILEEGVESGVFRPVDARFATLLALSVVNWTYVWYNPSGPLSPETVADRFAELLMASFLSDAAKSTESPD